MAPTDEIRRLITHLEQRVALADPSGRLIVFDPPSADDLAGAGVGLETARRVLGSSWWPEMVEEILETPDFAGPDEGPEAVLGYARDVVGEYIRKRFDPAV